METLTFNPEEEALLVVIGVLLVVQLLYYLCLYNRIHTRSRALKRQEVHFAQELPPLSVIIYAREEVENLRRNLTAVLEQDYPNFEVIIINDGNADESEDYLTQLEEKYPNLYHSFVPSSSRYISHKKLAITLGVRASKHDWLVFTEANCLPDSNQWLRTLARNFTPHTQIVLGYSGYERGKGWLHKRVSFDNLFHAMRYLGYALAGRPYIGIGRNMAYCKELFYAQKGFSAHLDLQRGDDDLFINKAATPENTRVETDADAIVRVQPVYRAKDWREEKVNYAMTAHFYKGPQRYLSGMETGTRLLFYAAWIGAVAVGIMHLHWLTVCLGFLAFVLRYAVQAFVINRTAADLKEKRRYYFTLPVFDFLQPLQSLRWKTYCLLRKKSDFLRR